MRSHLTRIHFPLLRQGGDILVTGEVARICFLERRLDLADLPFVRFDKGTNRFSGEKGLAALGGVGRTSRRSLTSSSRRMVIVVDMGGCDWLYTKPYKGMWRVGLLGTARRMEEVRVVEPKEQLSKVFYAARRSRGTGRGAHGLRFIGWNQ